MSQINSFYWEGAVAAADDVGVQPAGRAYGPRVGAGPARPAPGHLGRASGGDDEHQVVIPVFWIRVSFHADPDPGSQKCPKVSGSRPLIF